MIDQMDEDVLEELSKRIEITNTFLFLHLFGYLSYCIRDARSRKRQIYPA